MRAPISVIIPTLDAADRLGPLLGVLAEAMTESLIREVILADGGSRDGIGRVAEDVGARLVTAARGRGSQLRAGCAAARGDWLLILHADSIPQPGWTSAVRAHLAEHGGRAGYFDLRFDQGDTAARAVEAWANLRARMLGLPYGDQGLLVPALLYRKAGGYPDQPLMEDVALVRALGRRRLRSLGHAIVTSAERYRRDGWLRRGTRNLTTLALWYAGVAPERLARRYERS